MIRDRNGGWVRYTDALKVIERWRPPARKMEWGDIMSDRYVVVASSQSMHCCFDATVVDMASPVMILGQHYKNEFNPVCECIDKADAEMIAAALNAMPQGGFEQ